MSNYRVIRTSGSRKWNVLVDSEDYDLLSQKRWYLRVGERNRYAGTFERKQRNGVSRTKSLKMHRVILWCPRGYHIDHINRNGLDNRKCNLRVVKQGQNLQNSRKKVGSTSRYKGVSWHRHNRKWESKIRVNKKRWHLGYFDSQAAAARAYDAAARKLYDGYVATNFKTAA